MNILTNINIAHFFVLVNYYRKKPKPWFTVSTRAIVIYIRCYQRLVYMVITIYWQLDAAS